MAAPTNIASFVSTVFGLVLFIVSVWFLVTVDIHGNQYTSDIDYAQWAAERRIRLLWGTAASVGISVGLFQFVFSIAYVFANLKQQHGTHTWNLAAMIVHIIFLLCIAYSLALGIDGLLKSGGGNLHIVFLVFEAIEVLLLILYTITFERECGYFRTVTKLFSCDELKSKLTELSLLKFPSPRSGANIRMERLVEERNSLPV